jgi:hypothetical protein
MGFKLPVYVIDAWRNFFQGRWKILDRFLKPSILKAGSTLFSSLSHPLSENPRPSLSFFQVCLFIAHNAAFPGPSEARENGV